MVDTRILGLFDEQFLMELQPYLKFVQVLNLTHQTQLSDDCILQTMASCPQLKAFCLNSTSISPRLLYNATHPCLQSLSITDCPLITAPHVEAWYGQNRLSRLQKLYYTSAKHLKIPGLVTEDVWFIDQQLDIFSLWARASAF